jgi:hypothetical protein
MMLIMAGVIALIGGLIYWRLPSHKSNA